MRIPEEVLQSIRARVSIVDVVGRHVALKRAGRNWVALCPFHSEKTPSFVVNEERGTYHCFGCGAGGSVFRFLMEVEGKPFHEVVRALGGEVGIRVDAAPRDPRREAARDERESLHEILAQVSRYYRHQLAEGRAGQRARAYLERRGIPREAAERFGLGCAPAGWDHLARYLAKKGADLGLAERAGLVGKRKTGGYYDRFRDRLIFPIADAVGRVLSFGGRLLGEGEPKYLNGPESPVFRKGEVLYGLHQGREALRRSRRAVLVEGYLDVISLHARGLATALATMGTSLTPQHVQALRRWVDQVVLIYDGDEAGRRAAFRSLDVFLEHGLPCAGVLLPPEHDPDSYARSGGDLETLVGDAQPLLDLFLAEVARRCDLRTVEGRLLAVDELAPKLAIVADPLARSLYLARAAETLGVGEAELRHRVQRVAHPVRSDTSGQATAEGAVGDPLERALLDSLVHEPLQRPVFVKHGVEAWLASGPIRDAAHFVAGRAEEAGELPLDELPGPVRTALTEILVRDAGPRPPYPVLEARLRLRDLETRAARVVRDIRQAESRADDSAVLELLRQKEELDKALLGYRRTASGKAR